MAQGLNLTRQQQRTVGGMLDILGALAVNFGASQMAAAQPNLRWTPWGQSDNAMLDARLVGGVLAVGASLYGGRMGGGMLGRVGQDVAHGLLGSFIATERVRAASIARMQQQALPVPAATVVPTAPPWGTPAPTLAPPPVAPAVPAPVAPPPPALASNLASATQAARTLMPGTFR